MDKTEFELIKERLEGKNDAFALAFLLSYAHAKNVTAPIKNEGYLAKNIQGNYNILMELVPEALNPIQIPKEKIKSTPTFEDIDVNIT